MMNRPLYETVLCVLYLEWGNPSCCVPVLRALIGDCRFRSIKNNPQGGDKKDEKYWNRHQQKNAVCVVTTHDSPVFREMIKKVPDGTDA